VAGGGEIVNREGDVERAEQTHRVQGILETGGRAGRAANN
jgi:hypothetical protein